MKTKLSIFMSVILLFAITLGFAADVKVNPRLNELLQQLDLSYSGLEKVKNAKTDIAKQEAMFEYFKNRKAKSLVGNSRKNPPKMNDAMKKLANDALEHKFVGQRAYPPVFRGKDVIDWDSSPYPDREWILQFHRLGWWDALGNMYLVTGDDKYVKEWTFELESWINHMHSSKNFEKHLCWRPLETGGRIGLFARMPEYFYDSDAFTSYDLVNLLWTQDKHLQSLIKRYSGGDGSGVINNHRMHQWNGVLIYTLQYPEFKNNTKIAKETLVDIAKLQQKLMHSDGVINEYIPSYHTGNVVQFIDFRRLAQSYNMEQNFDAEYDRIIQAGVTAVMLWSHPDGTIPQFGDAWAGDKGGCQRFVSKFLNDYNRPDWEYFASNGKKGKIPAETLHILEPSGYSMMRSSWDKNGLFLITKNSNPIYNFSHNHYDNQSFELSAYGKTLMMDSGCYNYSGGPEWRVFFRTPQAHQLISIDNKPIQSEGKYRWSMNKPELKVIATTNNPYPDLTHDRTFFMIDNKYVLIVDEVSGNATGELRQHFQFMPGKTFIQRESLIARTMDDDVNLYLQTYKDGDKIRLEEEEGWISKVYMQKEPRTAIAFVQDKKAGEKATFVTILIPLTKERTVWDNEISVEGNTINFKINNLEDYSITFDHDKKDATLKKNFTTTTERDKMDAFCGHEAEYIKNKNKQQK